MKKMVRGGKSKRKHGLWNWRHFQAKAEWIDMNTLQNVSWSVIPYFGKSNLF